MTGGTDGLGLGYCHALAERGFNLIIISRNLNKIENLKKEFKEHYKNNQIKVDGY